MEPPVVWAIVVAAGRGVRFGGPKHLVELFDGSRVVDRSIASAAVLAEGVVVVTETGTESLPSNVGACVVVQVAGGDTRSASVRSGLSAIGSDTDIVVVHDAARPLASPQLFEAVVHAVAHGADAALPGLPIVDTVKRVADGLVVETLDRSNLIAVQTPQAFRASVLLHAHSAKPEATDDAALVEAQGGRVEVVPGEPSNVKLTTEADLGRMNSWIAQLP